MITLVQARDYRNLRDVRVPLREFQLLVGKNASGKSTFMDVIAFMSDFLLVGLERAVEKRAPEPRALIHGRQGSHFELVVEAAVPAEVGEKPNGLDAVRYRLAVEVGDRPSECRVQDESLVLTTSQGCLAQSESDTPAFETAILPEDAEQFPAATWFKHYLLRETHRIAFAVGVLARPNPPAEAKGFLPDGSNVASIVAQFREDSPDRFHRWVDQLRLDAPDLVDVSAVVRAEDGHSYLVFEHQGGVKVPAWLVSSGLLHLAAYTLPTYLAYPSGTYLYEHPERDVYAGTMHSIYSALTCLWDSQALVATQSITLMAFFKPKDLLCFARDDHGMIDVVRGSDHRYLRNWSGEIDVGTIVASGILG